jgi:hypothetical protein
MPPKSRAARKTVDDGVTRVLNCLPSLDTERDWRLRHAVEAGLLAAEAGAPATKDLRDDSWWTIADQGATGSCVGWATADSVLRWHFVRTGRIQKAERLSPRFTWMASKETDQFVTQPTTFIDAAGTSLKAALEVSRRFGAVRDAVLPFRSGRLYGGETATFYALAAQLRITAYFNLGVDLAAWRLWLANGGPILTRLDVDATWTAATENKGRLSTYRTATARGGHAVALVGYTSTGFIVRNSWGTDWGDRGYAYASNAYAAKAFTEAYGVTVKAV